MNDSQGALMLEGGPAVADALAHCLAHVARYHGKPGSAEALIAGLPMPDGGMTPELFIRAAERAGFAARMVNASLGEISTLDLPAVLLLRERGACVLIARNEREASIITSGGNEKVMDLRALAADYAGAAIAVARVQRFEAGTISERILHTHH